jgi:transcriptional regulator with XRE-family HTH domain
MADGMVPRSDEEFGELLRSFRLRAGLTQEKLALLVFGNTRKSSIGELENDRRRIPQPSTIARLSRALDLSDPERSQLAVAANDRRRAVAAVKTAAVRKVAADTQPGAAVAAFTDSFVLPSAPAVTSEPPTREPPRQARTETGPPIVDHPPVASYGGASTTEGTRLVHSKSRSWTHRLRDQLTRHPVIGVMIVVIIAATGTVAIWAAVTSRPATGESSTEQVVAAGANTSGISVRTPDIHQPGAIGATLGTPMWFVTNQLDATINTGEPLKFGQVGDVPVVANRDDVPGDEAGLFRPASKDFVFSNGDSVPVPVSNSQPGDWPIIGDWNGDGRDDIGIYRPATATFYLGGESTQPVLELTYGSPGSMPIAGDWDGDGRDEIGVYRDDQVFDRRDRGGVSLPPITFGRSGDIPLTGNWDGDPADEVAVYRMSARTFVFLGDDGAEFTRVVYGTRKVEPLPVIGDWNGDGRDTQGVIQ